MKDRYSLLHSTLYLALCVLFIFLLRPHIVRPALIGPDASEYIYCVEHHCLPHAPYILFLWAGFLLKPFVALDLGFVLLSVFSALGVLILFGLTIQNLYSSRLAGLLASLVMALSPAAIRYAGLQEIYPLQTFWVVLCWFLLTSGCSTFWAGLALGAALATHTGTLFAAPATLLLFCQTRNNHGRSPAREWRLGALGIALPLVLVGGWLLAVWISAHGLGGLRHLPLFLRGAAPSPDWTKVFGEGGVLFLKEWVIRVLNDLANFEVIGKGLCLTAVLSLLLQPKDRSAVWWLLSLPYLLYQALAGLLVDWGTYWLFVLPTVSASIALGVVNLTAKPRNLLGWLRPAVSLCGIAFAVINLPAFQKTAEVRSLLPWYHTTGEPMALCEWVRKNTTPETLVIQPANWTYSGLASALYTERLPIWPAGGMLQPGRWKPLFVDPVFEHTHKVTTTDFDRWLDAERPLVCFDQDPWTAWLGYWPDIDIGRYETRPILWLDQNQSGTSRSAEPQRLMAHVDIGKPSEERRFDVRYPKTAQWGSIELPLFRPTLFRIARRNDPSNPPEWVQHLQKKVDPNQRGGPPSLLEDGISFAAGEGELSLALAVKRNTDHQIRLLLQSGGADYAAECQVWSKGRWIATGRDMEKITVPPQVRFTELCFPIPAEFTYEGHIVVRWVPLLETPSLNAYAIDLYSGPGE